MILDLHRIVLDGLSAYAGNYRPGAIEIGLSKHVPPAAHLVPGLVEEMCDHVTDTFKSAVPLNLCAYVMWRLNWIHPFTDGNGRTGRALALWELYRRGFDTHHIFSVDEFYWEDRPRYYAALDAVRHAGDDLSGWLEYCAEGLRTTLERAWLRIQTIQGGASGARKLALRPRQEQLLHLLRDHGSMVPNEIWSALAVSRQGAMDLLRPLIEAGLVEKVGGAKTGHYVLKNVWSGAVTGVSSQVVSTQRDSPPLTKLPKLTH